MKAKYIGTKYGMPVMAPIGQKPRANSKVACVVNPGEMIDCSEEEAKALVALDPINFELAGKESKKEEPKASASEEEEEEEEEKPKAKAKPKAKSKSKAKKK